MEAGDWFICGVERGVEKAPVDAFCSLSNSSCSFGGRRGGEGPVANAGRAEEVEKRRRVEAGMRRVMRRDIVVVLDIKFSTPMYNMSFVKSPEEMDCYTGIGNVYVCGDVLPRTRLIIKLQGLGNILPVR